MVNLFDQRLVEPSPVARRLLWHVLSLGRVSRDEPETHPTRDKSGMFLFWVLSGRGVLQLKTKSWELSTGPCCWLVDMGQPRTFIPLGSDRLVTSGFRFAGPSLEAWCETLGGAGEFRFEARTDITRLQRLQDKMVQLATRRPANFEWRMHELITQALGHLLEVRQALAAALSSPPPPKPVTKVLDAVLGDPARAWRASELAQIAGISYSGLRVLFRESQHESLSEFLQRTRLDQARMFLTDDRLTVKQIARKLAFSSEFYFSQWFRRQSGISPSQFREHRSD
jgi:AraC-like DNA-binding protein